MSEPCLVDMGAGQDIQDRGDILESSVQGGPNLSQGSGMGSVLLYRCPTSQYILVFCCGSWSCAAVSSQTLRDRSTGSPDLNSYLFG